MTGDIIEGVWLLNGKHYKVYQRHYPVKRWVYSELGMIAGTMQDVNTDTPELTYEIWGRMETWL